MMPLRVVLAAAVLVFQEPALTTSEHRSVEQWLRCIDCRTELDTLLAMNARKPAATVDSLAARLMNGPPPARIASVDSVLVIGFVRDSLYRLRHGHLIPLTRDSAVARGRRAFVDGYRSRGALGLGWIHSPPALQRLAAALQMPLPASVQRAVIYARDSLPGNTSP